MPTPNPPGRSESGSRLETRTLSLREFGGRVALAGAICVAIGAIVAVVVLAIDVWFAVFAGILLAIFVRSLSDLLVRRVRVGENWAVVAVLVGLLGIIVILSWWCADPLTREAKELQEQLPKAIAGVEQRFKGTVVDRFLQRGATDSSGLISKSTGLMTGAFGIFRGTFQSIVTFLIVLFIGIYLSFSPHTYVSGLISLFPPSKREEAHRVLEETGKHLRYWIFGQIVSMVTVGVLISLGLYISGIPVPIVLGIIAGLLDIVPIFGPVIAALPALLLGFTISPWHALYVVITFVVANQLESHVLIPIVQRYSISLPPALTVVALFLMGSLFGFWGLLLAVPATAAAVIIVKRVYIGDVLQAQPQLAPKK